MTTSRAYSAADLPRLIDFLVEQRQREPIQGWHIGDLIWRMFYSDKFDPRENVRLWEDENGELVGFGWLYPPSGADLNPRDLSLLPEMIAWAQSRSEAGNFYLATLDSNREEIAFLEALGFQAQPPYGYHLRVTLNEHVPVTLQPENEHAPVTLRAGFTLRTLAGEQEAAARAEAHRLAFGTQNVTDKGYRNLVANAPIYDRDLDLMVIAPDGRIAAFCLCWLDVVNRVGLFEPVGTHPDFRRLGLARLVMMEGLRRLQSRGMKAALVATGSENVASTALYRSLGFMVESSEVVYVRP